MTMPVNVLDKSMNGKISLILKDGRILEGKLTGFDEYMNLVLENTEETIETTLEDEKTSNKTVETKVKKLGVIIIRGNNIVTISPK